MTWPFIYDFQTDHPVYVTINNACLIHSWIRKETFGNKYFLELLGNSQPPLKTMQPQAALLRKSMKVFSKDKLGLTCIFLGRPFQKSEITHLKGLGTISQNVSWRIFIWIFFTHCNEDYSKTYGRNDFVQKLLILLFSKWWLLLLKDKLSLSIFTVQHR